MTTALVTLTADDIKARVNTTNSFSKGEMEVYGSLIATERKAKRVELAKLTGSNVGTIVDRLRTETLANVTKMVQRETATTVKTIIELTAKRHATPADLLKEKAARAQKMLNRYENELEKLAASKPVTPAAAPATVPAKA